MADRLINPHRGAGLPDLVSPLPAHDGRAVADLLDLCPAHAPTPLADAPGLAEKAGVGQLMLKDERSRMGLGSFKALGAAYAIARQAAEACKGDNWSDALAGRTFVTASAGNHGLSVAAGARIFGADAVVYLAAQVALREALGGIGIDDLARRTAAVDAESIRSRVDPTAEAICKDALLAVSRRQAWQFRVMPLRFEDGELIVATTAEHLARALRFASRCLAVPCYFVIAEADTSPTVILWARSTSASRRCWSRIPTWSGRASAP